MDNKSKQYVELDIIRGIAVVLMLTNHAAVTWLPAQAKLSGIGQFLYFSGSFAPVVFFFVTGLGYGLSHLEGSFKANGPVIYKAFILIIMDSFMRVYSQFSFGIDFLAFIGISMIILNIIRGRKNAITIILLACLFLFCLRYVVGPLYGLFTQETHSHNLINIILGKTSIKGVSYWLTPWLIYPFIGFILGALVNQHKDVIFSKYPFITLVSVLTGLFILCISLALQHNGAIYFRSGTVSINYFILSFSVLSFIISIALLLNKYNIRMPLVEKISMKGISSLAVVPIHYFIIGIVDFYFSIKIETYIFVLCLPVWLSLCFYLARKLNSLSIVLSSSIKAKQGVMILLLIFVAVFSITQTDLINLVLLLKLIPQILLCFLLATSYKVFYPNYSKSLSTDK